MTPLDRRGCQALSSQHQRDTFPAVQSESEIFGSCHKTIAYRKQLFYSMSACAKIAKIGTWCEIRVQWPLQIGMVARYWARSINETLLRQCSVNLKFLGVVTKLLLIENSYFTLNHQVRKSPFSKKKIKRPSSRPFGCRQATHGWLNGGNTSPHALFYVWVCTCWMGQNLARCS